MVESRDKCLFYVYGLNWPNLMEKKLLDLKISQGPTIFITEYLDWLFIYLFKYLMCKF